MKLIAWNIRAGGGVRAQGIVDQLVEWAPDVVALSEFRGTEPSRFIARSLREQCGLYFQRSTTDSKNPAANSLLVASRYPLRVVRLKRAPIEPNRWLHVTVAGSIPFALMAIHIPNRSTGRKYPFMDSVKEVVKNWRGYPAVIMGDTNSGHIELDEENSAFNQIEDQWLHEMNAMGWRDAFRLLYAQKREFTWYSPNGRNGFRLDQMYVHPTLVRHITDFAHQWGGAQGQRRELLSDHAAMIMHITIEPNLR